MFPLLLAKTAQAAHSLTNQGSPNVGPIGHFPVQSDVLVWCRDMGIGTAILLVLLGFIYLLWGFPWHKTLIMINAAILGGYVGVMLGQRFGGYAFAGGFLGAGAAAAIGWPLMKWTVAVVGGICGAIFGATVWLSAGLDPGFAWAGALTGLIFFGMLSFILFRGSVIMYTALQGSVMLVIGLLGLAYQHATLAPTISTNMLRQPLLMPVAVLIPAILGLIYQQTHSAGGGGGAPPAKK